jgi:hypothetical protein
VSFSAPTDPPAIADERELLLAFLQQEVSG